MTEPQHSEANPQRNLSAREWCIRCNQVYVAGEPAVCPNAPDRGEHEALTLPEPTFFPVGGAEFPEIRLPEVRKGSSLHAVECPRANPHPGLPASVPCLCSRILGE